MTPGADVAAENLVALADEVTANHPAEVLFLSGAGISLAGPTFAPSGWGLTARAFRSFFESDSLARILGHHAQAGWLTTNICAESAPQLQARPPRLETVLGVAFHHLGAVAHTVLDDVRMARPNAYHHFFAAHVAAGGRHLTANFDSCVEDAITSVQGRWPDPGAVEHVHGRLTGQTTAAELGATLARIQVGFTGDYAEALVSAVASARVLVIVGYSGGDFFDVDAAFADLPADRLAGCDVHWISHGDRCEWHEVTPGAGARPQLAELMSRAGASTRFHCGPTLNLLKSLSTGWGFALSKPDPAEASQPPPEIVITGEQRTAATFLLYRELGIPAELDRMTATATPNVEPAVMWRIRSELLWEAGRWNDLRRMWWRGPLPPGVTHAERAERIGACLWAQGRLLAAYCWLDHHRRGFLRTAGPGDEVWSLAETQARVVEHMARTELRPLAKLLARRSLSRLGQPRQNLGVHRFRRHGDLASSLGATATGQQRDATSAATSSRWFAEAGSLSAAAAYRHRVLRDSYDPSRPAEEVAAEYRRQFRWAMTIGSTGGAWRLALLPDADRVFSLREIAAALLALQYGHWHRMRVLGITMVKRARRAVTAGSGRRRP